MDRSLQKPWGKVRVRKRLRRPKSFWPFRLAPRLLAGGILLAVVLVVYAAVQSTATVGPSSAERAQLDDSPSLPGVFVPPHRGVDGQLGTEDDRQHVNPGLAIPICSEDRVVQGFVNDSPCYTSNPPTSGPHSSRPMPFGALDEAAPKESLVHNMEHGGVVIWYQTKDEEVVKQLKDIVEESLDRRRLVVMSPYYGMGDETVALTSWTRLDKFPVSDFSVERIQEFIKAHQHRFNPEGF